MAASSTEGAAHPSDIWKQVNQFLQGGTRSGPHVSFESLSSSALFLLRCVPVARHAVLEHYANVFDDAVNTYLSVAEMGNQGTTELQENQLRALQDVTGILLAFIKSNPEAWAPVVSSWSLSLLGQMSSKYAARRGIHNATNLNEVLQMWIACPSAKMLIEITTDCFAAIIAWSNSYHYRVGAAPDMCVDSLLEASVRFSPHFDWVVAHIGSCFPTTIINRVLNCGLKDYCASSHDRGDRDSGATNRMKIPKMASVVGILGHLASKHGQDIRKALMDLFQASLDSEESPSSSSSSSSSSQQVTTLPFLLQLASMSPMLLTILNTDLVDALTPSVLNTLHHQFTQWKSSFPSEYNSFLNLVVHLLGKSQSGAFLIINFVLSTAIPSEEASSSKDELPCDAVKDTCSEIMHILLFELQRGVLSKKHDVPGPQNEIPLLTGLAVQTDLLTSSLLHSQGHRFECLLKLVTFTGLHSPEDVAASMLVYILLNAESSQQLSTFYKLKKGLEMGFPSVVNLALVQVFQKLSSSSHTSSSSESNTKACSTQSNSSSALSSGQETSALNALNNLVQIVTVERAKEGKKSNVDKSTIVCSMREQHGTLLQFVVCDSTRMCASALKLMSLVGFPPHLDSALLTQMCGALVSTFFTSLHQRQETLPSPKQCSTADKSFKLTPLCVECISQLSCLPFTKSLLIHYLVEGAVDKSNLFLFGGRDTLSSLSSIPQSLSSPLVTDSTSLLDQNQAHNLSISLPRSHSSVYHGGVIQQTRKDWTLSNKPRLKNEVWANRVTLVQALWRCCKEVSTGTQNTHGGEEPMDTGPSSSSQITPSTSKTSSPTPMDTVSNASDPNGTSNGKQSNHCAMSESAARTLGCVLVDILTQDSLYNDVCWPDPEFRKVTTERDTLVSKKLDEMSFLWDIIQEFSFSCVFVYYLSPVLRSVAATVMNSLEGCRDAKMSAHPKHCEAAIKLVNCLGQGSLLPAPLHNISELFPFVSPYEGFLLLVTVWHFIKDNPPSEFETEIKKRKCDPSHSQVMSSIIHANIDQMGHLVPRILPTDQRSIINDGAEDK